MKSGLREASADGTLTRFSPRNGSLCRPRPCRQPRRSTPATSVTAGADRANRQPRRRPEHLPALPERKASPHQPAQRLVNDPPTSNAGDVPGRFLLYRHTLPPTLLPDGPLLLSISQLLKDGCGRGVESGAHQREGGLTG